MSCTAPQRCRQALRELDDAKLAHPVTVGAWRGRRASEWRLTFYRCDKTGELPTTQWERPMCLLSECVSSRSPWVEAERDQRSFTMGPDTTLCCDVWHMH